MTILLIHQFYLPDRAAGGSRWNETCRIWAEQGHQITVIAGMIDYATGRKYDHCRGRLWLEEQPESGIRVLRTHVSEQYNRGWWGRLWAYFTFLASGLWAGLFRVNGRYDCLIVTSPPLLIGLLGVWLARWYRVPLVLEVRDLWPDAPVQLGVLTHPLLVRLAYWLEGYLYRQAQHIVVLTMGYQDVLMRQKGVTTTKIMVIPNAADFSMSETLVAGFDRSAFRRQHQMDEGFWVVYAGAHGLVNRLMTVLDAAEKLAGTSARFLLIGDGSEKQALQNETVRRRLRTIYFLDKRPKRAVIPFLLAADAGLTTAPKLPIFRTVLTNKLFDYFSCRLPTLAMFDGESCRMVEEAGAGLCIEPENADALVQAIQYYLNNPEQSRQHGENGYRYAQHHFDRRRLAQQFLILIGDVSTRGQTPD